VCDLCLFEAVLLQAHGLFRAQIRLVVALDQLQLVSFDDNNFIFAVNFMSKVNG
jgi:hypothetical protein